MLNALGDLIVTIFQTLVDVTIWLARLTLRPFRFLVSPRYREEVRQRWSLHPVRGWFEFIGGSLVVFLFIAMICFWTFIFAVGAREPTPAGRKEARELKQRIIEKIRRHKREKPNTTNQSLSLQPIGLSRCPSMLILTSVSSTIAQPRFQSSG
jgi:hypothetical protein